MMGSIAGSRRRAALAAAVTVAVTGAVGATALSGSAHTYRGHATHGDADTYRGVALPKVRGPITDSVSSHPWNDLALGTEVPLDKHELGHGGFTDDEYFVSGKANVYEWSANGNYATTILRSGGYTTRIIVRRPENGHKFNGKVALEMINPSGGWDYPSEWANGWREITENGWAYVGITVKPISIVPMKALDPARYADLSMANPLPPDQQTCGRLPGEPGYSPNTSKLFENGLAWDITTQIGALLKSRQGERILGGKRAERTYLTGLSQTGGYVKTYLRFIQPRADANFADGGRVFDGFIAHDPGGPGANINQCSTAVPSSDPQRVGVPPRGVPILEVLSQGGGRTAVAQADSNTATNKYVRWEVAGGNHDNAFTFSYAIPSLGDLTWSGSGPVLPPGTPTEAHPCPNQPREVPLEHLNDSGLVAIDRWATTNKPAPSAPRLAKVGTVLTLDADGNVVGGLRLPALEAPAATYTGVFENFECPGDVIAFSQARLAQLYGSHKGYVKAVQASAEKLEKQRFLTASDAKRTVQEAKDANWVLP